MNEAVAYGCRVLAFAGQGEGIWGHIALRLPGQDAFLMKPADMGLEEITVDDVITLNMDGKHVDGCRKSHREWPIHSEILRTRAEVNCVVHTHPSAPVVFSAMDAPLLPISNESCVFFEALPVYTGTSDLILDQERGQELAVCLGGARAMLLRNHGIVTVGTTVGEAVMNAIFLDHACRKQLLAMQCGGARHWSPAEEARSKGMKHGGKPGSGRMDVAFDYYVRQLQQMGGGL